jgi:hypothetical protein
VLEYAAEREGEPLLYYRQACQVSGKLPSSFARVACKHGYPKNFRCRLLDRGIKPGGDVGGKGEWGILSLG